MKHITTKLILALAFLGACSSCAVHKQVVYFQDLANDSVQQRVLAEPTPITLKPEDKISIVVNSQDPQLNTLFNLPVTQPRIGETSLISTSSRDYVSVYTVDPEGNIDFPVLGSVHVQGMGRADVASYIKSELESKKLLQNPVKLFRFQILQHREEALLAFEKSRLDMGKASGYHQPQLTQVTVHSWYSGWMPCFMG